MKKTIFTILICGVMILGLTGCNNSEKKDDNDIHTFEGLLVQMKIQKNISQVINLELSMSTALILAMLVIK